MDDLRAMAHRRLPTFVLEYLEGGSEDEAKLARKVEALAQLHGPVLDRAPEIGGVGHAVRELQAAPIVADLAIDDAALRGDGYSIKVLGAYPQWASP